jgi:hypothetical protein
MASLAAAAQMQLWDISQGTIVNVDRAGPVEPELLRGVEDRAPVRGPTDNYYEATAYDYLLVHARHLSARQLADGARRDLSYVHLFEEPQKYRGQVIHLEGRLRMLRRFDPPKMTDKEGITDLYEAWILDRTYTGNPYCVILSEIPASIQPGNKLDEFVSFDGFFFKRYRYEASGKWHDAPLLIGRTLTVATVPATEPQAELFPLLPAFLVLVLTTLVLGAGLTLWYRLGDRRVRERVLKSQQRDFAELEFEQEPRPDE